MPCCDQSWCSHKQEQMNRAAEREAERAAEQEQGGQQQESEAR